MNLNEKCLLQFLVNPFGNFLEEEKILLKIKKSHEKSYSQKSDFREIFIY